MCHLVHNIAIHQFWFWNTLSFYKLIEIWKTVYYTCITILLIQLKRLLEVFMGPCRRCWSDLWLRRSRNSSFNNWSAFIDYRPLCPFTQKNQVTNQWVNTPIGHAPPSEHRNRGHAPTSEHRKQVTHITKREQAFGGGKEVSTSEVLMKLPYTWFWLVLCYSHLACRHLIFCIVITTLQELSTRVGLQQSRHP